MPREICAQCQRYYDDFDADAGYTEVNGVTLGFCSKSCYSAWYVTHGAAARARQEAEENARQAAENARQEAESNAAIAQIGGFLEELVKKEEKPAALPNTNAPAFCSSCGTKLNDGAKFCPGCGTPVASASAPIIPQEKRAKLVWDPVARESRTVRE